MDENTINDISISGSGVVSSGEYRKIRCSGSVRIIGDIKCSELSVSGAVKSEGRIACFGNTVVSGSARFLNTIKAERLTCSGSIHIGASADAKDIKVSGSVHVEGDMNAERAEINGVVEVKGLLNAETVVICLSNGSSNKVDSIGGGSVTVTRTSSERIFGFFKRLNSKLITNTIEADEVNIVDTEVKTLRAVNAVIGEGCVVDTVEYSGTIKVDADAKVGNTVKL